MSFGMKNIVIKDSDIIDESKKELKEYIEEKKESYNLSFLSPNKESLTNSDFKNINEFEEAKMKSTVNNIKIINVIRYSAPILKFVYQKEKDDEKRSILFVKINEKLLDYANRIMTIWGIQTEDQSNNWIKNVLIRTLANGITEDLWLEDHNIEKLAMEIYSVSEKTIETKYDRSMFQPLTVSVKLAIIKSATPIYKIINKYPFLKNKEVKEKEIEKIMEFLVNKSSQAVGTLSSDISEEKDRIMLFKVILEESTKMFSDIWENNGLLFNEKYKNSTEDQMKVLSKANPNGIQIFDYVSRKFNEQYESIINLAKI